jgi:N-acetyl-1-D-myo-inositol-2-amino-2-deoxy-alpha-D-glucopyranoside deacetylase
VSSVTSTPDRATVLTTVVAALFAFAIGVAVGFVTTFTHRQYAPWGLIAGLVVIVARVAGFRLVFGSRVIAAAAAAGAVAATGVLLLPGAGGSAFVVDDPLGYAWAVAPTLLSAAAVAWPGRRTRRDAASGRSRMDA